MKEERGGRKRQRGGDLRRNDSSPDPAEPEAAASGRRLPKPLGESPARDLERGENADGGRQLGRNLFQDQPPREEEWLEALQKGEALP
jgi:hypothetical protein